MPTSAPMPRGAVRHRRRDRLGAVPVGRAGAAAVALGPVAVLLGRPGEGSGRLGIRMRRVASVAQIAATFALLVGTSLMAATVANLQQVEPGFQVPERLTFKISLSSEGFAEGATRDRVVARCGRRFSIFPAWSRWAPDHTCRSAAGSTGPTVWCWRKSRRSEPAGHRRSSYGDARLLQHARHPADLGTRVRRSRRRRR